MKQVESTISNLTGSNITLEIEDSVNRKKECVNLNPTENFILKAFDQELEIRIVKVNNIPKNLTFKIKISSFMTICQDFISNDIYIQDYVRSIKYKPTESSSLELCSSGAPPQYPSTTGNNYAYTSSYGSNKPGNYVNSTVSYPLNNTTSTSISTNYPSSYSTNIPSSYTTNYASSTSYPSSSTTKYPSSTSYPSSSIANYASSTSYPSSSTANYASSTSYPSSFTANYPSSTSYPSSSTANYPSSTSYPSSSTANYPSSLGTNFPSINTGSYNYTTPTMNFDTFKIDIPNINQNFSKDFSIPKTNFTSTTNTVINPSNNFNLNTIGLNSGTSNAQNNNNIIDRYSNTTWVNPTTSNTSSFNPIDTSTTINNPTSFTKKTEFKNSGTSANISKGNVFADTKFKKFGSFVVNQDEFEVNFIREDVVKNRLNVFNQVHRHNLKEEERKAMDYAELDQLKIKNKSLTPFYVRLSGGQGKDVLELLHNGETRTWRAQPFSIYKVNITTSVALAGVTYNIKSGCRYVIDQSNNLTDAGQNTLISTSKPYNPNFVLTNQYGVFFKKDDSTMRENVKNNKSMIVIVNRGDDNVSVKIEGDSPTNFEDYVEVEPLVYVIFKRREGSSYVLTYNKKGQSVTKKHLISSGKVYCFAEEYLGLCDDITKNSIDIYTPPLVAEKKEELNLYWEKVKTLIKSNPNKSKLKTFDALLFGRVSITNNSRDDVYIRVKSRKIGSEEFIQIKALQSNSWKRFDGLYLAEIVSLNDMRSKRYMLKTDINYEVNENLDIVDALSKKPLDQEKKESFDSKHLVFYDAEEKLYLRKEILYDEDVQMIKKEEALKLNEKEKRFDAQNNPQNFGFHDESPKEGNYEYFEGIKPDYVEGLPFTDVHFPPTEDSLRAIDPFTHSKRKPHFVHAKKGLSDMTIQHIVFKRPGEAFKGQYYLFKDEICYDDVKQGQIGNCYLMSILAALSQRPDLIKAVFKTQTVNPDGFYEIFYHEGGKKKIVFIDDHVVMEKGNFMPDFQFAKPNGEELWVMLIEKAYAKYEGGYSNILGGQMYPELQWLTGALTRDIRVTDPQCWNEIYNACKARHILVTGSLTGTGNHNNKSLKGISNGHAYSIMDAKEYRQPGSDKSLRLLKMRNPWGHTEWSGDYSDNSPLWTPELKAFFGFNTGVKNDGLFFMPFDDYVKEFKNVIICAIDSKN